MEAWRKQLYHTGIPGMKWGVRNGPPYPLGVKDMSASERRERKDKSQKKKKGLTDKQKRTIAIAAGVTVTALIAGYAGYRLYKNGALDKFLPMGQNKIDELASEKVGDIVKMHKDRPKDLPVSEIPKSIEEAFGNLSKDNPLRKADGIEENCTNVFLAFEGRSRGHDVRPGFQKDADGKFVGLDPEDVIKCFNEQRDSLGNTTLKPINGDRVNSYEKVKTILTKRYPEGSRGYFSATFNTLKGPKHHAVSWKIENGNVVFGDGVNGLKAKLYFRIVNAEKQAHYFRSDNLTINWDEYMKRVLS